MKNPTKPQKKDLKVFEKVPDLYLILSPDLQILTASDAYLKATGTVREEIEGNSIFEVFSDNPMALAANAAQLLRCSLQQVLETRQPHRMAVLHFDVPCAEQPCGEAAETYWLPLNSPVLDEKGQVQYIIHKVEDVTEMILTENKLAREFRHLNDAQAIGQIGSFERLLTENVITCSNEWYRLHGLEPQLEVITLDRLYSFFHPEDRQQSMEVIQHSLTTGEPLHLIHRIVRADGIVRHVQQKAEVLLDEQGKTYKIYGTVQDITEQVEARKKVEEREALLRASERVAHLGSYELDVGTMSFHFSDGMYRLFGEEPQAFVPTMAFIDEHSHPDDLPVVKAILEHAVKDKLPYHYTRRIYRPDGTLRILEAQGSVECDAYGNAIKLIGLVQDITDKAKAEQELKESKNLLQTVFDVTLNPIAYHKAVRDESGKIIDFEFQLENKEARKYALSDRTGKRYTEAYPGIENTIVFQKYCEVVETGNPVDTEVQVNLKGNDLWFHLMAVKLGDGLVATAIDITARKKAEQEARQQQDLLRATLNSSPAMIQVIEAIRNEKGEIVDFTWRLLNNKAEELMGNLVGKRLTENNPGVIGSGSFSKLLEVTETGKPAHYETLYSHEGINRWYQFYIDKLENGAIITALDITERKNTEQENLLLKDEIAQQATDKYYSIFNSIDEGFCIYELVYNDQGEPLDLRWVEVNPAYEKQTGLKDVVGKSHSELGLTTEKYWFDVYDKVAKTGEAIYFENWHGPTARWYHVFASRIGGTGSRQVAVVFEDITERKKQEQHQAFLLRFSDTLRTEQGADAVANRAIRMLFEELQVDRCFISEVFVQQGFSTVGPELVRPGLLPMKGVYQLSDYPETMRQLMTQPVVVHDADNDPRFTEAEKAMLALVPQRALLVAPLRQGLHHVIWALVVSMATPRHWTEAERVLLEELTERTWAAIERAKADEALRKSEEKYRTIFETIDEGFTILELLTDEDRNVTDLVYREVNEAYAKHSGIKDALGKKASELFPSLEPLWLDSITHVYKTGEPLRTEGYQADLGRWFTVQYSRVGGPGSRFLSVVFNDITERKQRELQQDYLLKLNDTLRSTADPIEIEEKVTAVAMEYFGASRCYYCTIEGGNAIIRRDAKKESLPSVSGTYPLNSFALFRKVIDDAVPQVVHNAASSDILDEELRQLCLQLQVISFINVPVIKNGEAVGILCVVQSLPKQWTQLEINLAVETAERTWAAVERSRAEEELAKSEEKYRTLFNSMDEGYCIIQLLYDEAGKAIDFRYLQVNEAFERNTGLQNAEGKTIRELAPDIEPKWMEIYDQVAQTGNPLRFEEASEALHHIFSLYAFGIGDPAEHKVAIIFSDVTERRKSQEALRQSEEQFRLFVTASSDTIYKMSADWSYMHKLTGKNFLPDTEEPTGSWFDVYIPATEKEMVRAAIQEAIQTKSTFELEHRVNKADGTVGWVSSRAIPVIDEQGVIKEWFGTAIDISLRKKAEQQLKVLNESLEKQVDDRTRELKESKLFAEQVMAATPDFIMVFNLLTNRVEYVNRSAYLGDEERYQETLASSLKGILKRAHPDDKKKLRHFIDRFRTASDNEARTLDYRVIKGANVIWYRTRGKVFRRDENGTPTHFISIVQDISKIKSLEEENVQMHLNQQRSMVWAILDAQEEERRRISEALHNSVGQSLYAAKIRLDHLRDGLIGKNNRNEAFLTQVDQILGQAINQTRTLSHELTPSILEQFGLRTAFLEIGNNLSNNKLRLQCKITRLPDKLEKHLQVVIYRIAQELANNIVRHAQATAARITLKDDGEALILTAEDNGKGFDPAVSCYDGIGLKSIQNHVNLQNGKMEIDSAQGKGTLIRIKLPLKLPDKV